jgi:hypothetical protein
MRRKTPCNNFEELLAERGGIPRHIRRKLKDMSEGSCTHKRDEGNGDSITAIKS